MRLADYVAQRLKHLGCADIYMVTGGAAMHLNDAFGRAFPKRVHNLHHEQSCAIAAESYARVRGIPAVVNVTAGPGGINAINGVFGAFVDSIPMIVISGQAKRETMMASYSIPGIRQLGDQEVDIISMVNHVCKYAHTITDPLAITEEVDRCFRIATTGRPGPVWLDIPIDVQAYPLPSNTEAMIDINQHQCEGSELEDDPAIEDAIINNLAKQLISRKRPVLYVGNGIRLSNSYEELLSFLDQWPIATVTGWNSNDLLWDDHPCYCGRPGTVGNRAGNFAVQFSECVVTIGCRLNIRQVSYNWKSFAKNAWKCHVDIDRAELDKPTLQTDLKIHGTIKGLFPRLSRAIEIHLQGKSETKTALLAHWERWKKFNKRCLIEFDALRDAVPPNNKSVNPYRLIHTLSQQLHPEAITVCADGTACVVGFQASVIKERQRLYHNSGCASMGYDLPAAIGAYHASKQEIICIAGDGSIMMNLQELAYIGGLSLPIKILLLNNQGYHSIRQTQNNYFPGNPIGCGLESGLPFPNFKSLCDGFGFSYMHVENESNLDEVIKSFLACNGPALMEAKLDLEQDFAPKLASIKLKDGTMVTAELEDMTPLLGEELMDKIRTEAFSII